MPPDAPDAELLDHLALASVPGLGPVLTAAVLTAFGSPAAARRATAAQLEAVPGVGRKLAPKFAAALAAADPQRDWQRCRALGLSVLVLGRPGYPAALADIPDPPGLLYVRGTLEPGDGQAVAMVGSRDCSPAGWKATERIAADLARAGWVVVSGLARGIDAAAHKGALSAGGRTLAVLATGLDRIYPPEHWELAAEVARHGALITETPPGVSLQAGMFPARNRIVSGLCRATVVVEAGAKSGALITVTHAAEQGREVMAVPGAIENPLCAGGLRLLRDGVRLVRSADDILEDLQGLSTAAVPTPIRRAATPTLFPPPTVVATSPPAPELSGAPRAVWDALASPKLADELAQELGLPASEVNTALMRLDIAKRVRKLPGGRYERG